MSFSWLSSVLCCGADEKPRPSIERNIVVLRDQPTLIPRPSAEPLWSSEKTYEKTFEQERERERQEGQRGRKRERSRLRKPARQESSSTSRHWFRSPSSTRRLQISGPTDFRHLHSDAFQAPQRRSRRFSFRPIELSIYQPHNRLSPILPHLDCDDEFVTPPPRAYTGGSSKWDSSSGTTLNNERSYSSMSFHLPRRHTRQESGMSDASLTPPRIPPKSRARANTAPSTERLVDRIASALVEKERLQAEINSLIERQSIYFNSRPSTAYDVRGLEPMPSIPALPAAAPSFAERLSIDGRPRTAPSNMGGMSAQEEAVELATAAFPSPPHRATHAYNHGESSQSEEQDDDLYRPLAPPLPLVLRPPLRKKKSFSRVSNWLFNPEDGQQQQQQQHNHGLESTGSSPTYFTATGTITTTPTATFTPRPLKEGDGFYQCVAPPGGMPRTSMETASSVYTWDTNEDGDTKTLPTNLTTAASTPRVKQGAGSRHTTPVIGSSRGFEGTVNGQGFNLQAGGDNVMPNGHRPLSVGVAF